VLRDSPEENPFRNLIPLSGDHPVLQYIIVAISALHLANTTRKDFSTQTDRQDPSEKTYKDALLAKQKALRLLSEELTNSESMNSDIVLASIMLFIEFELLDSGKNGWKFHTEGAKQLMVYLRQNGRSKLSALNNLRNCLISNCTV
jgi:hypothetical protein